MLSTQQHSSLAELVNHTIEQLGSQKRAAVRLGVNSAYVSHIVNDKFELVSEDVWRKIATALSYRKRNWRVVETFNTRALFTHLDDCKQRSLMMAVSHPAGGGKTAGAELYARLNRTEQVYLIKCREWRLRRFLLEICKVCGIEARRSRSTSDELLVEIVEFFLMRADHRPLLIIDESDKLATEALRAFIPLYNETEGELGIFLMGTDNLKRQITNGVTYDKKGYDEIESRIGRRYIELYGASKADVRKICEANGVTDSTAHKRIWDALGATDVRIGNKTVKMARDMRRLVRLVQQQQILQEQALTANAASN